MKRTEDCITIADQWPHPLMWIGQLTCTISSETEHTFKHRTDLHDDCLILPHHMQFTLMLSKPVYNASQTLKISLILLSLDFAEILPQWQGNILYGMLL